MNGTERCRPIWWWIAPGAAPLAAVAGRAGLSAPPESEVKVNVGYATGSTDAIRPMPAPGTGLS